jgi:alkylation response protein AidB-like acyl-CoA dehydrogenase
MFGTAEQKQRFLPRCAAGAITAFLLTEPDVGSDPARMSSTATPTEDGTAYLLDGVKLWTTNGVIAELVVVMARVPEHAGGRGGISAFVVDTGADGITIEARNSFMGLRGLENGVTRFHQVRVPVENRLGREGEGLKIALTTLNTGRLSIPALCAGASKWCLKIAREWSAERVQWGRPVGKHGAVAEKISFIAATTFGLEAVLGLSAELADAGSKDIRIEAALAKLWSSEMAWLVADELVQIRGGRGYETAASLAARGERAVNAEQLLRDLRINRIFEGSTEIMRLMIAREAVDAHLSAAGDLALADADLSRKVKATAKASGFYARWLPQLAAGKGSVPGSYQEFGRLARHLRYVERSSRKLARQTFYGMSRWQAKLEYRQGFLGRIVDIGAELFAMAAACSRAEMIRTEDPERGEGAYALADAFCAQARLRVAHLFDRLWDNTDDTDRRIAGDVLDGEFTWLEEGVLDQSEGTGPWIASWAPGPSELRIRSRGLPRNRWRTQAVRDAGRAVGVRPPRRADAASTAVDRRPVRAAQHRQRAGAHVLRSHRLGRRVLLGEVGHRGERVAEVPARVMCRGRESEAGGSLFAHRAAGYQTAWFVVLGRRLMCCAVPRACRTYSPSIRSEGRFRRHDGARGESPASGVCAGQRIFPQTTTDLTRLLLMDKGSQVQILSARQE